VTGGIGLERGQAALADVQLGRQLALRHAAGLPSAAEHLAELGGVVRSWRVRLICMANKANIRVTRITLLRGSTAPSC
jgi:hypothetical protein